jgi:hypothetical protein
MKIKERKEFEVTIRKILQVASSKYERDSTRK